MTNGETLKFRNKMKTLIPKTCMGLTITKNGKRIVCGRPAKHLWTAKNFVAFEWYCDRCWLRYGLNEDI
jgi:hypothetical protein